MGETRQRKGAEKTPPAERVTFGRNLARARTRAGLSQQDVERLGGATQPFLSAVERGKTTISIDKAARLANIVRVPLWQLLKPDNESA